MFVRQHLIGVCHPAFAEIAHFLSDQSIAEAELRASHLNHNSSSALCRGFLRTQQIMVDSQIVSIVSFSF